VSKKRKRSVFLERHITIDNKGRSGLPPTCLTTKKRIRRGEKNDKD
jgi:hypothetical protein